MKLLEMISRFRQRTGDYNISAIQCVSWLAQADGQVFNELGGVSNPDLSRALQELVEDVVSESRSVVVFKNDAATKPRATFDGKQCLEISKTAAITIDQHPLMKPSVVLEPRRATFYFDKPYADPITEASRKSSWDVTISYIRNPKRMLYLGGFQGRVLDSTYGVKGKDNLKLLTIDWPSGRPYFEENELSGSFVSLQVTENERRDYRIEEHISGILTKLFVNPNYDTVSFVDTNWGSEASNKGYRTTIHRSSELPESYHQLIVDRATELATGKVSK